METHRPGPLKQKNKPHNSGRHRSKGQIEKSSKGKTAFIRASKKKKSTLGKIERRNRMNQLRKAKRDELLSQKRSVGGVRSPPHYVSIIPLSDTCSTEDLIKVLTSCDSNSTVRYSPQGTIHVSYPGLKQRVAYVQPDVNNIGSVLASANSCDTVLFLWSIVDSMNEDGSNLYSCLYAQGLPNVAHAVMGIKGMPVKKQNEAKKLLNKEIEKSFVEGKAYLADTETDGMNLVRFITQQKIRVIKSMKARPHVLAEKVQFLPNSNDRNKGVLKVTGYLKGSPLSVNRLVHIPGFGDFQMSKITAPQDPYPLTKSDKMANEDGMVDNDEAVLATADPARQQTLQSENIADPLEGEQTWPTDEELAEADLRNAATKSEKTVVKVPKGTSSYQAAWIYDAPVVESDESDSDGMDTDNESDFSMKDGASSESESCEEIDQMDTESVTHSVRWADDDNYDIRMDMDQEKKSLQVYKQERENELFPDEVDTPEDMPARLRFARYRGLKSFRTSPWDPKENLPSDYSKIFQFANFSQFRRYVMKEELPDGIVPGWYITVEIPDVPVEVYNNHCYSSDRSSCPLLLVGLLLNEQKMSLLNFVVRRNHQYDEPIKSKENLIIQCGFRRFTCNPTFSEHSNGNKHKYERFLPQDGVCVLSAYTPIMYPPASVLVFKETDEGCVLVANGSLLSVDPDRLVIKRVVLSGHPFKINKKTAVVRYMFYNREDIEWFKPIELKTKYGRRGHIREPLGTHGHMKCVFDNQLKSQDTPLLMLYKRVFPKWTYREYTPSVGSDEMDG